MDPGNSTAETTAPGPDTGRGGDYDFATLDEMLKAELARRAALAAKAISTAVPFQDLLEDPAAVASIVVVVFMFVAIMCVAFVFSRRKRRGGRR